MTQGQSLFSIPVVRKVAERAVAWLDALPDACAVLDRELTVLYANAAFARAFGLEAPTGRRLPTLVAGFADSACRQAVARALESPAVQTAEFTVAGRHLLLRAEAVPEGVLLLATDITPRCQFEDELMQAVLHHRLVLEQLPTVQWAVDRDLRFTLSTGAGLRTLGLEPGEVVGRTLQEYLQTDDPDHLILRVHREALAGASPRLALSHRGQHYDCALEPLRDGAGAVVGVIGLAHDVTERTRAEEERAHLQQQVYRAQKLESLGVLAGGVAHDFNNLLTAILNGAEVLLRELPAASSERQIAELIQCAAQRGHEVTRQMLTYAGKGPVRRRALDLNGLIRENLRLLAAAVLPTVAVRTELVEDLPAVWADPGQMQQVVMNLMLNAAEALQGRDGTVRIATGTEDVPTGDELPAGPHVFVAVSDDGCGMSPEVQARIFDPFFTTKATGRGLGLSAVQGIVGAHQGAIRVRSEPGKGTTFRVLLPVASSRDSDAARDTTRREQHGPGD